MEIFFCDGCGKRITDLDFQAGKALEFEGQRFCEACSARMSADGAPRPGGRPPTARATPMRTTPARTTPARTTPARGTPARGTPPHLTPVRGTPPRLTPARGTPAARLTPGRTTPARGSGVRPAAGVQDVLGPPRSTTAMRRQRREAERPKPLFWLGMLILAVVVALALALLWRAGKRPDEDLSGGETFPGSPPGSGPALPGQEPRVPSEEGAAAALAEARRQAELAPWLVRDVHEAYLAVSRGHPGTGAAREAVRLAAEWQKKVAGSELEAILAAAGKHAAAHFSGGSADDLRGKVGFWMKCWTQAAGMGLIASADRVKPRYQAALQELVALKVSVRQKRLLVRTTFERAVAGGWRPIEGGDLRVFREGERGPYCLRCESSGAEMGARFTLTLVERNTHARFDYRAVGLASVEVRAVSETQGGAVLSAPVEGFKTGAWARAELPIEALRAPGDAEPSGRNNAFSEVSIVGVKEPGATEAYLLLDAIFIEEERRL